MNPTVKAVSETMRKNLLTVRAVVAVALISGGDVFGESILTGITVGTQAPAAIAPGNSATYVVTVSRAGSGRLDVDFSVMDLPTGASADFTPDVVSFVGNSPTSKTTTLTISTTASIPGGTFAFRVRASGGANVWTNTGTLTIIPAQTSTSLSSSANPCPTSSNVTLTATVNVLPPATGMPSGTVQFVVDGLPFGTPVHLSSGTASIETSALGHGHHTVIAEYADNSEFRGSTNALSPDLLINSAPVPVNDTLGALKNTVVNLSAAKMAMNDRDPENDPLTVTAVSSGSAQGGGVLLSGGTISYTPPTDYIGPDSFTYTITDSFGANGVATINVNVRDPGQQPLTITSIVLLPDGNPRITFVGIPGRTYVIEATANLAAPVWVAIGTNAAGTNGLFTFTDLDATNYPSRFYRTAMP
jgi:hypothetical protein